MTSISSSLAAVSSLAGAVLAGMLIGLIGASNVLWVNAAAFGISALAMLLVIPEIHELREVVPSVWADIVEGLRHVLNHAFLRGLIVFSLAINSIYAPLFGVLLPYMAKAKWGSPFWFGLVVSGFGAGALIGAILSGVLISKMPRSRILRVSIVLFTMPPLLLIPVPPPWLAFGAVTLMGLAAGLIGPLLSAALYRIPGQEILGRVQGVVNAGGLVASPIGILLAAPLLAATGLTVSFGVIAIIMLLVGAGALLGNLGRELDALPHD